MRYLAYCFMFFCLFLSAPGLAASERSEQIKQFVAAFNAHDAELMSQYVTDDIQWLSVNGDRIAVETSGKTELIEAMDGYFKSCASCQSKVTDLTVLGNRVSTEEEASWRQNGELRSQKSLAIYEFNNSLIRRVYYFPAE
ncbi:nuclear transport factor 2 family protein [Idiomarina abyssalis]|uniref:nuclear transport factor 2 family protein n=1 Tax=Idiomarina abyssalis TaxID=86102 RepID=UPI000E39BBBB|nr:nuclear transport factor 2 family protein [Idiomarina sp. HD9-110m-PIT-SAG05]